MWLAMAGIFGSDGLSAAESPVPMVVQAPVTPDSGDVLVRCGRLIDGLSDQAMAGVDVLIRNGRIEAVAPGIEAAEGVPVLALPDHTCLPGLIEMHAHLLEDFNELVDLTLYYDDTLDEYLQRGRVFARANLDAGFTTVRNLAVYYGWADRELKEEINRGETLGPRMYVAGYYLTIPGGGGDLLEVGGVAAAIPPHLRMGVARDAEEFREKARLAVDGGADLLKVIASGAVLAYGGVPGEPEMTPEQIRAVVEVANEAGIEVAAHAHGAQSIREAILAGVRTIEHATYIDDEGIRLALEHDVALSMDVGPGDWMIEQGRKQGWVEEFIRKTIETTQVQRESFRRAHEAGVSILFGTDVGIYPHGMNGMQFRHMVEWGMSPMEAIQAATSVAAEYLPDGNSVGSLAPGMMGDLVAVPGDPLADINLMEQVEVVIKGGLLIKSARLQTQH